MPFVRDAYRIALAPEFTMLPPILEIFVLWHPQDTGGAALADRVLEHFHGNAFSGLLGGAVEVYMRHAGWGTAADAPRPIPFPGSPDPMGVGAARVVAVVPLVGNELASTLESGNAAWQTYVEGIASAQRKDGASVGVFPFELDSGALSAPKIRQVFGPYQRIAAGTGTAEPLHEAVCRDLSQGIAQLIRPLNQRLNVFISHTKRVGAGESDTPELIRLVREIISETRLRQFFDANDLQPGTDWDSELRTHASTSSLLVLRTDLYATREWCQREMLIAKRNGMPIVTLDCVSVGEERGSFLMDHVPRVPVRRGAAGWEKADVRRGLNLLVDECLKRELWQVQRQSAAGRPAFAVSWWAPHAPEPVTLLQWIEDSMRTGHLPKGAGVVRVLHPDPPLGPDESATLQQIVELADPGNTLDVLTPRTLASRGA
jgi:hypothetical protein